MTARKKNAVLYEVCKYIVNLNLDSKDLRNLLSSIETGEFGFLMGKVVSSLHEASLYDQRSSEYINEDIEKTVEYFLHKIKQKSIPVSRVISYLESLGFHNAPNELGFRAYIREFLRQSTAKTINKFSEFIDLYNGKDDPYLNMIKK